MWLALSLLFIALWVAVLCGGLMWPLLWHAKRVSSNSPLSWRSAWWHYWHYLCQPLLSWRHRQRLARLLMHTGQGPEQAERIFAYQCGTFLGTFLLILLLGLWWGEGRIHGLPWALLLGGILYWYPVTVLQRTMRQQQLQVQRDFPFMLDLLTLSIEAGMGIQSALQLCVTQLPSYLLRHHLQLTLDDLRTGLSREQAFSRFAQRVALDEAHAFVAALQQSFELGGSLGPLLRQQAQQRRQERFLRAEKKALEAPVKMLLPLVVCIFPCTFLVIGYPLFFQLWQNL